MLILVATSVLQWGHFSPMFDKLCLLSIRCLCFYLITTRGQARSANRAPWSSTCPTLPLFRLGCTLRCLLSSDIWQSNNVKLMSALTPTQSAVKWFSVGVGFDLPPRWFPQRRATRALRYSPQFSPGFSPMFWHLIPGWGPKAFWGSNGTIWVQNSLWGTGHTVRTQETYDSGGHI